MLNKKTLFAIGVSFAAMSVPALAQVSSAPAGQGEQREAGGFGDIIVTAQKREQSVMDVGASLSVLGDRTAWSSSASSRPRIWRSRCPALTFARSDYNTPIFSLRGIGFNSSALAAYPAVSFYVDEVPFVFSNLAANATFDLQRIEVLKGPQGTLFGQNSTGGAIA